MNPLRFPNEYATSKYGGNASIRRSASAVLQTKLQTTLPTELSATTRAAFPTIRDEWLAVGLSTVPANRAEAERGVRLAYNVAGLEAPSLMIWVDSPIAGCVGAAMQVGAQVGDQVCDQVWDQVRDQVWVQVGAQVRDQVGDQVGAQVGAQVRDQVWDQVGDQVRTQVRAQVWDQVGDQVGDQVWAQVGAQVGAQVRDQVWDQVRDQVRTQVGRAVYGQHDAGWLSVYSTLARENIAGCERLVGIMTVARAAGWWWPFERAVILTERPCRLRRDGRGRLHSTDGAAIQYPEGWGVWAWHGIRVNQDVIESDPATWRLDTILGEPNTEIRRVKLERFSGERLRAQAPH